MSEYKEHEIKVLDVNVYDLRARLEELNAIKVFDDERTITVFDTEDLAFINQKDKLIRITEEGTVKVTMHINQSNPDTKEEIKFKTSRMQETADFFHGLGLDPICKVTAYRASYELGKIDFDIDKFPLIPPFLEIDIEHIEEEGWTVAQILKALGLEENKVVVMGTEDIHKLYGINYFEAYKINKDKVK